MTSLYLVEDVNDIDRARKHAVGADPLMYPVSPRDPYFFDAFEHPDLQRWDNTDEFLHIRHYDWIYKYREHQALIAESIQNVPRDYAESLNFYLAFGFGHEERVFSDYLSAFCHRLGADTIYLRDRSAPYATCLHLIQPYRSVRVASYAG